MFFFIISLGFLDVEFVDEIVEGMLFEYGGNKFCLVFEVSGVININKLVEMDNWLLDFNWLISF